jgi:hypothetical protein
VRDIVGWLGESYPALFAAPDLVRRLWLYQLATAVRDLFLDASAQDWLRDTVEGPHRVLRLLPA